MKHTKLSLIVSLTILTSAFQIGAMHQLGRIATKIFTKKNFSWAMTVVGVGIAGGSMMGTGIYNAGNVARLNNIPDEVFRKEYKVPFWVKSFVKKTTGDNNLKVGKITNQNHIASDPIAIYGNQILIHEPSFVLSLEDTIKNQDPEDLNMYRFILHCKYNQKNDIYHSIAAMCTIPVFTFWGALLIKRSFRLLILPKPKPTNRIRWLAKELANVPLGLIGFIINTNLHAEYMLYRQQKADDGVPDKINILEEGIRYYKKKQLFFMLVFADEKFMGNVLAKRIKKLEDRVKNLKQQESH